MVLFSSGLKKDNTLTIRLSIKNKCRRANKSESTWGWRFGVLLLFVSVWKREVWRNQHEYVNSRKGHRRNHHNPPTPIFLDCLNVSHRNICGCRHTSGSPLFSLCGSTSNKLMVIMSLMWLLLRNFMVVTQHKDREQEKDGSPCRHYLYNDPSKNTETPIL